MTNNSSQINSGELLKTSSIQILLVLQATAVPIIVCGNVLIIVAVLRYKNMRYASNMMIMSLAFADMLMGGVYLPLKILLLVRNDLFSARTSCVCNAFLSFFSVGCAMNFLSLISIERFYAVQFPFHYHSHMTVTRSLIYSGLTVTITLILSLPSLFGIDTWRPRTGCFTSKIMPRNYTWSIVGIIFFISLAGFFAFLRVMVAEISVRIRDQSRNMTETRKQDSVKSTLMLTVYVFSMMCWLPQLAYTSLSVFDPGKVTLVGLVSVSFLGICSSGINCFIYGIKHSKFRAAYRNIFGCKSASVDVESEMNTVHTTA